MISILPTYKDKFRTLGWVQNPSNFRSLCDVVAVFDCNSAKHKELKSKTILNLISLEDGRTELLNTMNIRPLKIKYSHLVGTAFKPRSSARCNGIIQATVKGQGDKLFVDDWSADGFIRWAHCFGFIKFDYETDTFEITENGLLLTLARTNGEEINERENELLINAILAYPPAIRILSLLAPDGTHLTKFEIGKQLGFVGEDGFTSMPQGLLVKALSDEKNTKKRNDMRTDWEGSADKYARMIGKWLAKLGLTEQIAKRITVTFGNQTYTDTIGQAYTITAQGLIALNRAMGKSKHARIPKNICFEMLATKGSDREYLRTRRAFIIKYLTENKVVASADEIRAYLTTQNITETNDVIYDDIQGLLNIGLNIKINTTFQCNDAINDFIIPLPQALTKSSLTEKKDEIRSELTALSHEYLSLIDLAYDSKQNRLFEMKTIELLTEECKYSGTHLGGSRKPDGVVYTTELKDNYGVIIDTKAYSIGYPLPISQADEMERYIRENQTRDERINPNKWWENFDEDVNEFYFMFVSGHFIGNYGNQLRRLSASTSTNGSAIAISELLLYADKVKSGVLGLEKVKSEIFQKK